MKKNIVVLAALVAGAASLSADEAAAPEGPALSISSTLAYDSLYVFRGTQFAESILSPAISGSYGDFYCGLWFALPLRDEAYFCNEMDANVGYGFTLTDSLSLDVGVTRYTYDDIPDDFMTDYSNTTEFYVGASLDVPLSPAVYIYRDIDLDCTTVEARASYSFTLSKPLTLDLSLAVGDAMPDDGDEHMYYAGSANLTYAINDSSSVSGGVRIGGASEDYIYGDILDPDECGSAVWFGMSYSTSF